MSLLVSARFAILQALISGDAYGLEIIDRVSEQSQGQIKLGQGSLYPALRQLERSGLVESYEGEPMPERGGRPRRYYQLTAEGARAASEQRAAVSGLVGMGEVVRV